MFLSNLSSCSLLHYCMFTNNILMQFLHLYCNSSSSSDVYCQMYCEVSRQNTSSCVWVGECMCVCGVGEVSGAV